MSDFDDRARAAGERMRRDAAQLAAGIDPTQRVAERSGGGRHGRMLVAAAAAVIVLGGVAGLLVAGGRESADDTDLVATTESAPTTTEQPEPSTTSTTSTTTSTTSTTSTVPEPAAITRPIIDPDLCTPIFAFDNQRTGLPRDPGSSLPVTLFATSSELPVPIQVIGDPVDGPEQPFALIQRYYDRTARMSQQATTDINGTPTFVRDYGNRNGEAEWTLPDGSVGYLRSRDLTAEQITAIVERLTPRPTDAEINGFDYRADDAPAGLQLVAERMNTEGWDLSASGSQCIVEATGYGYRISRFSGDPTLMFAAVIDRPVPLDVTADDAAVTILAGPDDPTAPSLDDLVDADEDLWRRVLEPPSTGDAPVIITRVDGDVEVPFVAIGDPSMPSSSLTLRIVERDGVAFLEVYESGAVIADAAEYWKLEIDERVRLRTSATPGPGRGVRGTRLGDAPFTASFFVRISTTDGDDQPIQTTGVIQLVPS
jgi:hypothetical protein